MHPAKLLTIRNTRRSLEEIGYNFPSRNLIEKNINNSEEIELFYSHVFDYISNKCFEVEKILYPDRKINLGFVKANYQQRVASSLYSCIESLKRRFQKLDHILSYIKNGYRLEEAFLNENDYSNELDEISEEDLFLDGKEIEDTNAKCILETNQLYRGVSIECAELNSLISQANELLSKYGDLKIKESIDISIAHTKKGDRVLIFSRYTDTVDALIKCYKSVQPVHSFGVYTGDRCSIIKDGKEYACNKEELKNSLFDKQIDIVFCSDAASEGLNLQAARVLINVDVPWTPARLEQRIGRVARLGQEAKEVDIYNVWYPNSIEARMYHRIQKRLRETNLAIGEFPEVVADSIKNAVLMNVPIDDDSVKQLNDIRNSEQTKALKELWLDIDKKVSTSDIYREKLIKLCDSHYLIKEDGKVKTYLLNNGTVRKATKITGMKETISLKNDLIKNIPLRTNKVIVYKDGSGSDSAFVKNHTIIKHEAIFDVLTDAIDDKSIFDDKKPVMLPDMTKLDFSFAVDGEIEAAPEFWPPKKGQE